VWQAESVTTLALKRRVLILRETVHRCVAAPSKDESRAIWELVIDISMKFEMDDVVLV
jgi:hypothetical protein